MFCVGRRGVNHGLLILRPKKLQTFGLTELHDALTEAGHVAVTKNSPNPIDESVLLTISFDELVCQESNDSLTGG